MTTSTRPILVIGEALVDVVRRSDGTVAEHPGGSPANVAVALARLGARVELGTAYAADRLGALLDRHFEEAGVGFAGDPHVLGRTSTAIATIEASGAADYVFDVSGDLVAPRPSGPPLLVHVGSLAAVLPPGADSIAETVANSRAVATISYDINARPAATGVDAALVHRVEMLVAASDVVKASDEDLAALYPDLSTDRATRHLLDLGAGAVVITRGGQGATLHSSVGVVESPASIATVVDTIGAGDSFCAAMLDGLRLEGVLGAEHREALRALPLEDWRKVLERAGRAAAITVSRAGANPPYADELRSSAGTTSGPPTPRG